MIIYSAELPVYPGAPPPLLLKCLSTQEQERLDSMQDGLSQREFLSGRVLLRTILSYKLGLVPAAVPIAISPAGRPYLRDGDWDFSLSHAGGRLALALDHGHRVGVDLEPTASMAAYTRLPASFARSLGMDEVPIGRDGAVTPALTAEQRWTMCEAYAKCHSIDVLAALRSAAFQQILQCVPRSGWRTGLDCAIWLSTIRAGRFQLAVCGRRASGAIRIVDYPWQGTTEA